MNYEILPDVIANGFIPLVLFEKGREEDKNESGGKCTSQKQQ